MTLILSSAVFVHHGEIPKKYTCEGENLSPPLTWSGVPQGMKSFALIIDDPDAPDPKSPKMTWVHWVLYNIPSHITGLAEGISTRELPLGIKVGLNDWKQKKYGGPCPPIGRHRYFHKLYALDTVLPEMGAVTKVKLEMAVKNHLLGKAELIGTYQKSR